MACGRCNFHGEHRPSPGSACIGSLSWGAVPYTRTLSMGISNLLQFLKPITTVGHVEECRGQVVGVDAMCWMHRGAAACAVELVEGKESDKFLRFFISMVSLLRFYGVTPLVVFDGSRIDVKSAEDEKRRLRRETAKREALELLERKRKNLPVDYKELMSKCSQSISITPAMVDKVIAACRELGIRCIVAPFEADAQLAYLSRTNQIHSAISEDSDLLAYGCKRVMLKMDKDGKCDVIRLPFLQDENDQPEEQQLKPKTAKEQELVRSLKGLNHERFVAMCVLGGCDYTNRVHINGMGIATACRLVSQLRSLKRVLDFLCRDKKWSSRFPVEKEEVVAGHLQAEKTFLNHQVFDPKTRRVVLIRSHEARDNGTSLNASFEEVDERAIEIASGLIDPRTGATRQRHLSPAECELIRECQERAFSGLESQQLKAQAAAYKAQALRKQAEEKSAKKADSRHVAEEPIEKKEAQPQKTRIAATIARTSARCTEETPVTTQESLSASCSKTALWELDKFAAGPPIATTSEKATKTEETSLESYGAAKRLLQGMTPQGFHVQKSAVLKDSVAQQVASLPISEATRAPATADLLLSEQAAANAEGDKASATQGTSCSTAACSLSQFAYKWEKMGDKPHSGPQKMGRRDVVVRTRFAHRTKLISAAKGQEHPFHSLTATAATLRPAGAISMALPQKLEEPDGRLLEGVAQTKRKRGGFLTADDSETSSAFLSVRFAQEDPKRHKLL